MNNINMPSPGTGAPTDTQAQQMLDPVFANEPPPKPPMPKLDNLGLDEIEKYMTPETFNTFVSLMHYAVHWQEVFEGKEIEWSAEKMAVAAGAFVGFGNPVTWENVYRHPMRERILPIIMRWHRRGRKYQKKNPLPWLFLDLLAADFAQPDKGYENALKIEDILQDDDFQAKWKKSR